MKIKNLQTGTPNCLYIAWESTVAQYSLAKASDGDSESPLPPTIDCI